MADPTGMPLDELAVQLIERECRAQMYGGALVVALGGSPLERVITTDGQRFRWGSLHGNDLGPVDDVAGAVARVLTVLSGGKRHTAGVPSDVGASKGRLAALEAHLSARGFQTALSGTVLEVVSPQNTCCEGEDPCDSISCHARDDDDGRLWFFTALNEPIEPASHITDTALRIQGYLSPPQR